MMDFSTENLFEIRDGLQKILTAIQAELNNRNPELTTHTPENFNPENIQWYKTKNREGKPYERYPAYQQQPTITPDYTYLLDQLQKNNGKYFHGGLFYFLFDDNVTIGRKSSKTR